MINSQALLTDLQRLLPSLERDIREHAEGQTKGMQALEQAHQEARAAERTAQSFIEYRDAQITQAAVAWVLSCVFVRFLEDNQLLQPALSGPAGDALQQAKGQLEVYFREDPTRNDRDYLLHVFEQLQPYPVMKALLDPAHNPLWQLPLSADGAKSLLGFFQSIDPDSGDTLHDFTDPDWDTRFLGDLYQDLSESVRKRYALLQTPEFVEDFILDYTLDKAVDAYNLSEIRLIDPTCGSGHFLLGAFARLFALWQAREPGTNTRVLAERALKAVHGVDINPYAVAVARFRLLIAAMHAADCLSISKAPAFPFNLAVGDSLLHGKRHESQGQGIQIDMHDDPIGHVFATEDSAALARILNQQYHAVVGNPPYIVVRDKAQNAAYRAKYLTCYMKYSLGIPFTERFFDLALAADGNRPAGFVGMITANSFMKREFGRKLIEEFFPRKDLTHVIDTSGAYIPGHGTPTVVLFGRNRAPVTDKLRAVLGIRGEPSTPDDPAQGLVWRSIVDQLENPGSENTYISVVNQPRELYCKHPWSVGGGGASDLKENIEKISDVSLRAIIAKIGFQAITGEDDVYVLPEHVVEKLDAPNAEFGMGEIVRDWGCIGIERVIFPYRVDSGSVTRLSFTGQEKIYRYLWANRVRLSARTMFGKTALQHGQKWFGYMQHIESNYKTQLSITFAEVASHNHFVLDRGGKVFKQTAPVIKLPLGASNADHLALIGLLNSSTVCFWMKQVCHQKQMTGGDGVRVADRSKVPYQFAGTALKKMPIPKLYFDADFNASVMQLAARLDQCSTSVSLLSADRVLEQALANGLQLAQAWADAILEKSKLRSQMLLLQEELDWRIYHAFSLCGADLFGEVEEWFDVEFEAGERPFEILAGINQDGYSVPASIPAHWPMSMQQKWQQRIDAIKRDKKLRLIEDPHYKRRWIGRQGLFNHSAKSNELISACRNWLLDCLELQCHEPELLSASLLSERVRDGGQFQQVAALYTGNVDFDQQQLVAQLIVGECVPAMAAARYKPNGVEKYRAWQLTWELQRAEDAIDARCDLPTDDAQYLIAAEAKDLKSKEIGEIPLPPNYADKDFRQPSFKSLRGKLDVPKERFFSLPGAERDGDSTQVFGWAGLDHLQRATAIATWHLERREQDGWQGEQLLPTLVAMHELLPWLLQWHNEMDPEYGERMGDYYQNFLLEELRELGLSMDALGSWQPPAKTKRRTKK